MKKRHTALKNIALLVLLLAGFISCERDFIDIGTGIAGETNFITDNADFDVISYNMPVAPMQTNGLTDYLLGYYKDPAFGAFSANIVAQMTPTAYDPDFGENVVLDSVVLTIPYFNEILETDDDGNSTYRLDSLFGGEPYKLSIYQNNFFLRSFDPNSEFGDAQKYYSDKSLAPGNFISDTELEGTMLYQEPEFVPSPDAIVLTTPELDEDGEPVLDEDGEVVMMETGTITPSLRVHLDNPNDTYWQDLIFAKEGQPELSNENNFVNYFRGLYFKAEPLNGDGNMIMFNLATTNAGIVLYYTSDSEEEPDDNDSEVTTEAGTFEMNFTGNRVNFFNNEFTTIPIGDAVNGDEKLFLKGGQGNMAILNLFNGDEDGNSDQLTQFKSENWLINEAHLVFYVDQSIVNGEEPERIIIYDVENDIPVVDYFFDASGGNAPEFAKLDHLQPLVRVDDEPDGEGIKYEIEITEHIKNIFQQDSTNVKLGLLVTSNVSSITSIDFQDQDMTPNTILSGAVLSPRGTVLFGNNTTDESKKLKLKIFYTEPEN